MAAAAAVDVQHVYFSGEKTNSSFSTGREDARRVYLKWEIRVFDENSPRGIRTNAEQECSSGAATTTASAQVDTVCSVLLSNIHLIVCVQKNVTKTTTIIPARKQRTGACSL